jgi:hypothetical protein
MNRQMTENWQIAERQSRFQREAQEARLHRLAAGSSAAQQPSIGRVLHGRLDRLVDAVRHVRPATRHSGMPAPTVRP